MLPAKIKTQQELERKQTGEGLRRGWGGIPEFTKLPRLGPLSVAAAIGPTGPLIVPIFLA